MTDDTDDDVMNAIGNERKYKNDTPFVKYYFFLPKL